MTGRTIRRVRCVLAAVLLGTVSVLTVGSTTADAVDAPPTNTAPPGITGVPAVGQTVTADPGTWDPADVTYAYTWLVDDQPVASGEEYTPAAADEGRALTLEVVASRPDTADGTATSEPVTVLGAAPQNLEPPVVSGGPFAGDPVRVTNGTWDADGLTFTYQWRRGGDAIAGATGSTYFRTQEDCGQDLVAVVTAHRAGHADGIATTAPFRASCGYCRCAVPTRVEIHTPQHVTTHDRARVRVRISAPGEAQPQNGRITLRVTRRQPAHSGTSPWLHMVHLHPDDNGRVTFRLPRLAAGKFRVAAKFDRPPKSQFMDGDSATVLKVTRAG